MGNMYMLKISHENVYTLYTYIFCKFLSFPHYNIAYSKGHLTDMLESTVVVIKASSASSPRAMTCRTKAGHLRMLNRRNVASSSHSIRKY